MAVSGAGKTGAFLVGLTATVTITGMTVEDGRAALGGAIQNDGTLDLDDDTISGDLCR